MNPEADALERDISACLSVDQLRLRKQLRSVARARASGQDDQAREELEQLVLAIEESRERREHRARHRPSPRFPDELPVCERRAEIAAAIEEHQVVVICGETGSGKSTQLPKICLELGRGVAGMIGHTQPRRIAARGLAARLAEELDTEVGHKVGFKVRFSDHTRADTYVKVMTDGMLLAEIRSDRQLQAYDTLIIDEAHERSLNIDFLLGFLKLLFPRRPDLKLIITSATIDPWRFSRHFDGAPVIEVSGRTYPVDLRYRPPGEYGDGRDGNDLQQAVLGAVDELVRLGEGDILVFMPGERDIRETTESLRKHHPPHTEIVPLYARLSAAEQNRVFRPHAGRRIVIATNVAETSLTVPGIRYVIDTGTARISRYSHRAKVQRLPVERISRASADQRAGRCGRVAAGVCIRLYSEEDYESAPAYTDPEILRTNLASVILQMEALGFGDVEAFPFVDAPDRRYIKDGYRLLHEIGALDERQVLTGIGRQLSRIPLDPRIARMVLGATEFHCLSEILVIAAGLSIQDPRERPLEAQQAADEARRAFRDPRSDFLDYLKMWDAFNERYRHLSRKKLHRWCREHFLSYRRMREWRDIHGQLHMQIREMGLRPNEAPADYESLHKALLTGLLGNIAFLDERREYTGARGNKLILFPGSTLSQKPPKWIMAAELIETTRLYAHTAARIEPGWIELLGVHLLKRSYFGPHWDARRGRASAFERVTLYGLVVQPKRKVDYSRIEPREAREIFIRGALVEEGWRGNAEFLNHNRTLIEEIRRLEDRTRRHDIMVDPDTLYRFYDERIPEDVTDVRRFDRWRRRVERKDPRLLFMSRELLMRRDAEEVDEVQYPSGITMNGVTFSLDYRFRPGEDDDGVTMTVPLAALNQVNAQRTEWMVPGMLREKITGLIKALPKRLRRHFVPAGNFSDACWEALRGADNDKDVSLLEGVGRQLERMTGVVVPVDTWRPERLPAHLLMNFRVVDDSGRCIASGRDLARLQVQLHERVREDFAGQRPAEIERADIVRWDFGDLPETVDVMRHGVVLKAYPALVDHRTSVSIEIFDRAEEAGLYHRRGSMRLFSLALSDKIRFMRKNLPGIEKMCLHYAPVGGCDELRDDLIDATVDRVFVSSYDDPLRAERVFGERLREGAPRLLDVANELCGLAGEILLEYHTVMRRLNEAFQPGWVEPVSDMKEQLGGLVYKGFVLRTPPQWLRHYPRYLKAVGMRLDKLEDQPDRDRQRRLELRPILEASKLRLAQTEGPPDEDLIRLRWLLEEFRVSLFAQELRTAESVSAKRLRRYL